MDQNRRLTSLHDQLRQRILILDGAMGTMIQSYKLSDKDYRGVRFAEHRSDLKGNNDLLCNPTPNQWFNLAGDISALFARKQGSA